MNLFLQLSNTEGQIAFRNLDGLRSLWQNVCVVVSSQQCLLFICLIKKGNFELHNLLQDLKLFVSFMLWLNTLYYFFFSPGHNLLDSTILKVACHHL